MKHEFGRGGTTSQCVAVPFFCVSLVMIGTNLDKIIPVKTVLARTGLSRSTLYRKIAEGTFPCQVKVSVHGAGWRESVVNRCLADPIAYRKEGREAMAAPSSAA